MAAAIMLKFVCDSLSNVPNVSSRYLNSLESLSEDEVKQIFLMCKKLLCYYDVAIALYFIIKCQIKYCVTISCLLHFVNSRSVTNLVKAPRL